MRSNALLACALSCAVRGTPALAAETNASQVEVRHKARALYADGMKAFDAGDYAAAETDFEDAYATLANARVLLKIAECKIHRSDYPGAVEVLEHYVSDRPDAPDRTAVESRIAELKKKPGVVSIETRPSTAAIWVDGSDTGRATPANLELAPGSHSIAVKLSPHETVERNVTVEFGATKTIELTLAEPPKSPVAAAPVESLGETPPAATYRLTPAFWVTASGAALAASVMTVFGVMALDKQSEFRSHPTRSLYDEGKRDALVADIALGVGAASAAAALFFLFTSKHAGPAAEQTVVVAPTIERRGGGVVGDIRF